MRRKPVKPIMNRDGVDPVATNITTCFLIMVAVVVLIVLVLISLFPQIAPSAEPLSWVTQPLATLTPGECHKVIINDIELSEDGTEGRERETVLECCISTDGVTSCTKLAWRYPPSLEWHHD